MLPAGPHVKEVFSSKNGLFSTIKEKSLCIDCSTIDIATSKQIAQLCADKNVIFNDAPVSGGVKGAELGTLTFMVGAKSKADFEAIKPFLECMGVSDSCFSNKKYMFIILIYILEKYCTYRRYWSWLGMYIHVKFYNKFFKFNYF